METKRQTFTGYVHWHCVSYSWRWKIGWRHRTEWRHLSHGKSHLHSWYWEQNAYFYISRAFDSSVPILYFTGLIYDYPSVSQINYVARQNNINLIFAIVLKSETQKMSEHLKSYYSAISAVIENSKTGSLDKNSDNVVKFISDIYDVSYHFLLICLWELLLI